MRPSDDIAIVAEFIADEIENRELSLDPAYTRRAREAWSAFSRILDELSRLQSCVPCIASESECSGNRETGGKDG